MADRATRWPSARKGGARSSASDAMAQASIGSAAVPGALRRRVASLSEALIKQRREVPRGVVTGLRPTG